MKRSKHGKIFDLENRLIEFTATVIAIADSLPRSKAGTQIAGQLIRSGSSPTLHYGEVQSAESKRDFIHKMKVVLKELRETLIALKLLKRTNLRTSADRLEWATNECDQLIAIFARSTQTAEGREKNH
jgi:four helix bundle protein